MKARMPRFESAPGASMAAVLLIIMLLSTAVPTVAMNMPAAIGVTPAATPADPLDPLGAGGGEALLHFTSAGHVLGFGKEAVYLAGLDHALRVEFSGGVAVQPIASGGGMAQNGVAPLGSVTYRDTWNNIDVIFSAVDGGIAESTYIIHPGGDPGDISLRYNVPLQIMSEGGLRFHFENGYMTESAPIAWQDINGQRQPVAVQFQQQAENQVGFSLGSYAAGHAVYIDPVYQWHTFYGSSGDDRGVGIAVDSSGNVYVTGYSTATWNGPSGQLPLNAHAGGRDIVVIKLNASGTYQWHTFYGSSGTDEGENITVDSSANVYVTGHSTATWGSPLNAHAGGGDIVVIKLDTNGAYQWHTFYISSGVDYYGYDVGVDSAGNVYVTDRSTVTWNGPAGQSPLNAHAGGRDIVVIKLDTDGSYCWHTFYGSTGNDDAYAIAVDSAGNVYVTGQSSVTWNGPAGQLPLNDHAGNREIVVIKLDTDGNYDWHTFYGSTGNDDALGIAVDTAGNVYVTGWSARTWNGPSGVAPLNAHAGSWEIVIVKLNSAGAYQWHTFYGSSGVDWADEISVDTAGCAYVVGTSYTSWNGPGGSLPSNPFAGVRDIVVIKLHTNGDYQSHTFYGSSSNQDHGRGIALGSSGGMHIIGDSVVAWNGPGGASPLNPHEGGLDIVVIKSTMGIPPTVTTNAASAIDTDSATLNMSFTVGDYAPVDVWFAWREKGTEPWTETTGAEKAEDGSHSAGLSGLASDTTYEFRARLSYNPDMEGDILEFTTAKVVPTVTTLAATDVDTDSATLNMSYTLGDYSTVDVRFAYKKEADAVWTETSWVSHPGSPYALPVSGLDFDTTYDFKAQLRYDSNHIEGATLTFTTLIPTYTISGTITVNSGIEGVEVVATGGHEQTVYTDEHGYYELTEVAYQAESITITPTLAGFTFDPPTITVAGPVTDPIEGRDFGAKEDSPAVYGVAAYDQTNRTFHLMNELESGPADDTCTLSNRVALRPVAGDWDGDGFHGVGGYDQNRGTFYLKDNLDDGAADTVFTLRWALRGWHPVAGDWTGDGEYGVGVYDPNSRTFYLKNALDDTAADLTFTFSWALRTWLPVAGDWNGDGKYGVGLYDPMSGTFYLMNALEAGTADHTFAISGALRSWLPLAGDWSGDGVYGVGLYDPMSGTFRLTNDLDDGNINYTFSLTRALRGWWPVAGFWTNWA